MKKVVLRLVFILTILCITFGFSACNINNNSTKYKINFEVDGAIVETIKTDGKSEVTLPSEPYKDGVIFCGWFFDKDTWNSELKYDTLVKNNITKDVTVYAKWKEKGYKATFVANGTTVDVVDFDRNDSVLTNEPNVPSKVGYIGEWENYVLENKDITINAIYTPVEYKITYTGTKNALNNNKTEYTIETDKITLQNISKDGFTFLGWYDGDEKIENIEKGSLGDKTLTAKWDLIDYSATFYASDVKVGETTFTVESESLNNIPNVPEKNGYTGKWNNYTLGTSNIRIDATYTPINYSIEYIDEFKAINNNKTSYNIETETFDLTSLAKKGYVFDGWFDDLNNNVEKIEKGTIGNKTLTAKWSIAEYTITYLNTKDAVNNNPGGYTIDSDTITLESIFADGYTFNGWYVSEYSKKSSIPKGSYGNLVLTAKWTPINYSITYEGTKGASNTNKKTYNVETTTFELMPLTKVGYRFNGWFDKGIKVERIEKGSIGERTLTAQWSLIDYTLTYVNTKNATNNNPATYTIESEEINLSDLTVEGYKFEGWYLGVDDDKVYSLLRGGTGNLTLTAKWSTEEYQIQYENTKGAINNNNASYNIETETFYLVNIEKDGYTFEGWFNDSGAKISKIEKGSIGNITLTAKWSPIQYTATFFADGIQVGTALFTIDEEKIENLPTVPNKDYYTGAWETYTIIADDITVNAVYTPINYSISYTNTKGASNSNFTTYNYESSEIVLQDISVDGYKFEGWFVGEDKVESIPTHSNGIKVFVAKWSLETYDLIYENTKGSINVNQLIYTIESEDITLSDLSAEGFTFIGWFMNDKKVIKIEKGSFGDKTLTAKWSANSYKVMLSSNVSDAEYSGGGTYKYESEVTIVAQSYVGYIWSGWYEDETILTDSKTYTFDMPATNISYTAKYTLCENHTTDKYCVCTKCGKTSHKVTSGCTCSKCGEEHALMTENGYCRHDNYVYFGYYPQTIKSSSVSITSTAVDENGYYTGSDNKKYAKVVADPYSDSYTFSTGNTITSGTTYYFKVEPIKWSILTEEDEKAFFFVKV